MKYALIIGINYFGTDAQLNGCIKDAMNLKQILIDHYGFLDENITLLIDDNNFIQPTSKNIIMQLYGLIMKSYQKDVEQIWISYSGHGSWIKDYSKDEIDGKDEVLVPSDFKTSGIISDDLLYHVLSNLNPKTKCFCIFDCCHSGTIIDLDYIYDLNSKSFKKSKNTTSRMNHLNNIIMLSGCKDDQVSQEFYNQHNDQSQGALTSVFIYVLQKYKFNINIHKLLFEIRKQLKISGFSQIPQISCNHKDTNLENLQII